jgi:hypothetical protein
MRFKEFYSTKKQGVAEGKVIKANFGQKFNPKLGRTVQTSPYKRNPDIEVPIYDPVKNRVWHEAISDPDHKEPFDHFEVERMRTAARIIGVTKRGKRIVTGTTSSHELADALVDAYNRGGFTDKHIERVRMSKDVQEARLDEFKTSAPVNYVPTAGVAEAKSPQEFMSQITKVDPSILDKKKDSPYYMAGKMLDRHADKIGRDDMDFADFKRHAALLMGSPEDNMKSAKQVRNLDTAARDDILDKVWEYSATQKDADTYYKVSGFKRLR